MFFNPCGTLKLWDMMGNVWRTFQQVCTQFWYKKHIWTKTGNIAQKDRYDPFIMTHFNDIITKFSSHLFTQMTLIMDMGEMFNFPKGTTLNLPKCVKSCIFLPNPYKYLS